MSVHEVSSEENHPDLHQVKQSIFKNVQVGGDLKTGDITQNNTNITINQPELPKPVGIPQNIPYTICDKLRKSANCQGGRPKKVK